MDTILVLDTSGSMKELKSSIITFIDLVEKMDFKERIAIISFGEEVRVLSTFTRDYERLKSIVYQLPSTGGTLMAQALKLTIEQLQYTKPCVIGPITLMPRVILFNDGEPSESCKIDVINIAKVMGSYGLPMVCIGVAGCDKNLMQNLATFSGGMFLMAEDVNLLQLFFVRQELLVSYIMEVKEQLENLYNRELLREYMQSRTNQPVSDEEIDGFIFFLQHLIKRENVIEEKRCSCCCCVCSFRNLVTSFLFLLCLASFGWSGYALHVLLATSSDTIPDLEHSTSAFAAAFLIIALLLNFACSIHIIHLRSKEDDSVLWLVEVLTILFFIVPEVLLFVAAYRLDRTFVLPSAITLSTVFGVCCFCNCCVRCCDRSQ